MGFYRSVLRPLAFRFDPEWVHEQAMGLLAGGLFKVRGVASPRLEQTLFGVRFPNPLGLAAGFDKNAVAVERWEDLGFGFAEIGTVTSEAQPGNPKPRLFRVPECRALINRMGFNNEGAAVVAPRLDEARPSIPIGVNLGKSRIAELAQASSDYAKGYRLLHRHGDYFVVNVSSPNTPGLRTLQEKGPLVEIVQALREVDSTRPLFVKVAPDLEPSALDDVLQVAHDQNLTGLLATNTTTGREGLDRDPGEEGGMSGGPLWRLSNEVLAHLARRCDKRMVLIGVGGIFSGRELFEKIELGAHLCQVYTGWVYGGPSMVPRALAELLALMDERGVASLDELRGSGL